VLNSEEKTQSKAILKRLALVGGTCAFAAAAYEVFSPRATLLGRVPNHGPRSIAAVGLVFDKSPNRATEALCGRLHELGVPATFFIEGRRAERYAKALRSLKFFEIGIHGEAYSPLIFRSEGELRRRLAPSLALASDLQGRRASFLLPPYGWKDLRVVRAARMLGLTAVNPALRLRWREGVAPGAAAGRALGRVRPGDIMLISAPENGDASAALPELVTEMVLGLKEKGLSPWGLSALLSGY
jgi:peptidoglycan/xylan/chitin deacetylase (PgdA/CDA1 family)